MEDTSDTTFSTQKKIYKHKEKKCYKCLHRKSAAYPERAPTYRLYERNKQVVFMSRDVKFIQEGFSDKVKVNENNFYEISPGCVSEVTVTVTIVFTVQMKQYAIT